MDHDQEDGTVGFRKGMHDKAHEVFGSTLDALSAFTPGEAAMLLGALVGSYLERAPDEEQAQVFMQIIAESSASFGEYLEQWDDAKDTKH